MLIFATICRLCATIQSMEAAFQIAKNSLEASKDSSVLRYTDVEKATIMKDSLIIQVETVRKADNYVSYSDSIAKILYDTQHSKYAINI